jgi:hypothetical protein
MLMERNKNSDGSIKLQVGDKVRRKLEFRGEPTSWEFDCGVRHLQTDSVMTISNIVGSSCDIKELNDTRWEMNRFEYVFEVGNKVRVSSENTHNSEENGKEGTIVHIDSTKIPYRINFGYGHESWVDKVELMDSEQENKPLFKIGDKVRGNSSSLTPKIIGKDGVVVTIKNDNCIGVEFYENISGHDLDGICEDKHGWYCNASDLDIISIVIIPKNVEIPKTSISKMESNVDSLKGFDAKNLTDAKKSAEEELAQTEINTAKAVYLDLFKKRKAEETKIKDANAVIKELDKQLGVFNKK